MPSPRSPALKNLTGSVARARRLLRVGVIGVGAGAGIGALLAFFLPSLIGLDPGMVPWVRAYAVALGLALALVTAIIGPSGEPPGARLAARIGVIVGATGVVGTLISVFVSLFVIGPLGDGRLMGGTIGALAAGSLGVCIVGSMLASVVAGFTRAHEGQPSSGVRLPLLVGGAASAVTAATWALATAHLVGHLYASARQTAVEEARDLAQLLAELSTSESEGSAQVLVPPGGFTGRIGPSGEVIPASGSGLSRDAMVEIDEGPPTLCRVRHSQRGRRAYPCAVRLTTDGTRVVAAVTDVPVPLRPPLIFVAVGLLATTLTFLIGYALGRGPADDLNRVAAELDALAKAEGGSFGALDQPILALSLDEVGDLAVSLAKLRVQLRPGLVEHDEALRRARAADRERDHFLGLVSTELRSPLDRILGASRELLEETAAPLTPAQREDVRLIVSSATHLTGLLEEVLDLSAIATGRIQLREEPLDFGALVTSVARAQRPLLRSKVELRTELPDHPEQTTRIDGDERRLRQVVTNLISNAVKFTSEGQITLTVRREGERVVLVVGDTGPGIDPAHLPRLFTEFVQLGNLRQRARGTGLGLAICRRLLNAHGGSISATSAVGVGSTFTVTLPVGGSSQGPSA